MLARHLAPLALLGLLAFPAAAAAQTMVPSGNLVGSQTWTAAGSPYVVQGDLTVPLGLTLTLQAGTVVHLGPGDDQAANLDSARAELRVAGTLSVTGTAMNPVVIRSSAASPATGDFYGVVVLAGGAATATSLQVERGLRCVFNQATGVTFNDLRAHDCNRGFTASSGSAAINGAQILRSTSYGIEASSGASLTADAVRIQNGNSRGLSSVGAVVQLTDSVVSNNASYGIYMTSGGAIANSTLTHNTVHSNNSYGLYLTGNSNNRVTVRDNLIVDNRTYGIYRSSSPQVTASYNLVWDNGTNYSGVSGGTGALSENPLLVDPATGDFRITGNSGARSGASDGTDIGALAFDGTPTGALVGHLFTNLTLTAAASPHIVPGDLTVEPGVTLTIEPGAEVRFTAASDQMNAGDSSNRTELRVEGTLTAIGLANSPILLTSSGTTRGDWYGVRLLDTASAVSVDYATIQYAQYGVRSSAPTGNLVQRSTIRESSSYGIYADSGAATFDRVVIRDGSSRGATFIGAGGGITNSQIFDNASYGIYATSGGSIANLAITGNTIVDNNSYGVYLTGNSNNRVTLRNNIIVSNVTYGVYRSSSPQVTASYNLVWGNGTDYSGVSGGTGAVSENPLFVDQANEDLRITSNSPARLHSSTGQDIGALVYDGTATAGLLGHLYADTLLSMAASPHVISGDLTIEPGVTLTIEPGAELRFASLSDQMGGGVSTNRTELRVLGTLVSDGTTSRRITMTSNAASRGRGDWYGVHLLASASASLIDYSTIEYAQYGVRSSAPAGSVVQRTTIRETSSYGVWGDGGAVTFSELVVRDGSSRGFSMIGAAGAIADCLVYGNSSYGIYATSGGSISNLAITGNTIADNNSYGVYLTGNSNNRITLRDNIISGNRTYGVYRSSSPQVTASYNLVWSNGTDYSGVSGGTGAISENPLFVNPTTDDYRITSRSPARMHASDSSDIGALTFDGALTVGEQGHLYADTTWTPASGPILVLGDITVEPGVTLTVQAGTEVRMAAGTDSMAGNNDTTDAELIVQGRLQVTGTTQQRVTFTSAGVSPGRGDWYGIHLTDTAANTSIRNARIRYARYGLRSSAPNTASITQSEIDQSSTYGVWIDGGAVVLDGVYVHDGSSRGVSVQGGAPALRNMVIADNASYGVYATSGGAITNMTMDHLTIDNNNSYGVYLTGNSNLRVNLRNSSITNNRTYGIYRSSSPQVTLGRNNVWTNGTDYSGVSAGAGSISVNPQFVNAALGNYQLLPSSTLIDAADPATALGSDFEGTARPLDGDNNASALPDLGAFEFNPSSNRWPIADGGPDRVATSGLPISFDASGSVDPDGTISTYLWDFGDGTTGTGVMVTHTYSGGTDRTVTLTVTDNAGAQDVDTVSVEVNLPPIADAGPPRFGDPGEIVGFTGGASSDSDGTVVTYAWNFGDGTTGSGLSVTHQYGAPGTYTVTLTVTDDDGATAVDTTTANIAGTDTVPPVIAHTPVPNGRTAAQAVTVTADVTDASGVGSATLYYRAIGATTFTPAAMSNTTGPTYAGTVPSTAVTSPGVEYYVSAADNAAPPNTASQPSNAPTGYFTFTVNAPPAPTITHTPIANGQAQGQAITITADITAPGTLASASIYYRAQGGSTFTQLAMSNSSGSTYQAQLPPAAVVPPGVEYYLEAVDSSQPPQTTTNPLGTGSVHAFTVTPSDTSAPTIAHTPIGAGQPAGQAVTVSADITDGSGVQSATLFYRVAGAPSFSSLTMVPSTNTYSAAIPAASVTVAGVDYYIEATDQASPANTGTSPVGAPTNFNSFTVMRVFNVNAGDLVISEVMADPSGSETLREWFELYNTTGAPIDIDGFTFSDDGVDAFTISNGGPLNVPAGGYLVLGRSPDTAANGGVNVDYVYSGMALANTSDEIVIAAGSLVVDRVAYDAGTTFPRTPGYSVSLDPLTLDAVSNDVGASWCAATTQLSGGDFGTPGAANDSCQDMVPPVVVHTPISDGQAANVAVAVSAVVTDADSGLDTVELFYRISGQGAFTAAAMADIGSDVFQAEIPAATVTVTGVEYYIRAVDLATGANETLEPSAAPGQPHAFAVTMTDTSGPSINHNPISDGQSAGAPVEIIVSVVDPSGVQDVLLNYRPTGGTWASLPLTDLGQDVFTGEIPSDAVTVSGVQYYLSAQDSLGNASSLPADGEVAPFTFTVTVDDLDAPIISHTPVTDGQVEGQPVAIEATVTDASGLAEVRLYFRAAGDVTFLSAPMTDQGADLFRAEISGALVTLAGVDYYLEATDDSPNQNTARDPVDAPNTVHRFTVRADNQEDTEGPSILHLAIDDGRPAQTAVKVIAEIVDPSGVAGAAVRYRTLGQTDFTELALVNVAGTDRFEAEIPAAAVVAPGVEYYLTATDGADAANLAQRPPSAPDALFSFTVGSGTVDPGPDPRDSGCTCRTEGEDADASWWALLPLFVLALRRKRS